MNAGFRQEREKPGAGLSRFFVQQYNPWGNARRLWKLGRKISYNNKIVPAAEGSRARGSVRRFCTRRSARRQEIFGDVRILWRHCFGRYQKRKLRKRRTFAIISHPDAQNDADGKDMLLYGGAIALAGSVKGKKDGSAMPSRTGWRSRSREEISVTSSVMQFRYNGYCINILDTPGHQDFSEDTYRTLMAADSAVMVIDAAKGVEPQTRKPFQGLPAARHPDFHLHQQDGPRRPQPVRSA